MKKFEDILAESNSLTEEARDQIMEAWNGRIAEAREELAAELREEFAQKFEHDKAVMVESMDKFLTDKVHAEIAEFAEDKKALAEERVRYKARIAEHAKTMERFIMETLASEVKELREDRQGAKANMGQLEDFVLQQLAEEVKEFHSDKKALAEQRVKLVREGKQELKEAKAAFVKKAAALVEKNVNKALKAEITSFRADIKEARENDFGRRIFESFVSEYMTSHLNESSEVSKLQAQLEATNRKLDEAVVKNAEQKKLTESVERRLNAAKDRMQRDRKLTELLRPLGKNERGVMEELLQTVKTDKLEESFKKYLPAVLNEKTHTVRKTLNESRKDQVRSAKTGDKRANAAQQQEDNEALAEIQQIKKMAGIN